MENKFDLFAVSLLALQIYTISALLREHSPNGFTQNQHSHFLSRLQQIQPGLAFGEVLPKKDNRHFTQPQGSWLRC
jgi:hypothetical protein